MRTVPCAVLMGLIGLVACDAGQAEGGELEMTGGRSGSEADAGAGTGGADAASSGGMGASTGGGGGQTGPNMALEVCGSGEFTSLGACLEGDDPDGGVISDTDYAQVEAHVRGTLAAISRERVACESRGLGWTREDAFALELRHEGDQQLRVIVDLPLDVELAKPGDELELTYERQPWGAFHEGPPPLGSLELRSAEGELLLWIGQSGQGPAVLQPPEEISLAQGTERCRDRPVGCAASHHSLYVRVGTDEAEVAARAATAVGDYLVWLQHNEEAYSCTLGHPFLVAVARKP